MLKQLKKCKTIKEIYEVLGLRPFEIGAVILVVLWILLPMFSTIEQIMISMGDKYGMYQNMVVAKSYQQNVESLGILSVEFALVYLMGRFLLNKGCCLNKLIASPWNLFLLLMLGWSCISTLLSDDIKTSFLGTGYRFDGLETYFFYAAIYVCGYIIIHSDFRNKVFTVFALVSNIVALLVILQDGQFGILKECFVSPRAAMFFHFNHTGYYMCMGIACVIGLYLYEKRMWLRIYYVLSMALQVYGILVNSTFGSYLGACCGLIMALVFFVRYKGRFSGRLLTPLIVVTSISVASYMGLVPTSSGEDMKVNIQTLFGDFEDLSEEGTDATEVGHGRMFLWKQGLKMIAKRPVFGYGPEQIDQELSADMWLDRNDNEIIQYGVFLGIPGMLFYLAALLCMFVYQWKHMKKAKGVVLIAAGCVVTYLVSSLFGNTMFYTTPYFFLFLAMAGANYSSES